ncbi:MAG TPA: tetratricopeptide repeat protein [Candidatus Eremiobacteraeota bacterium]|nr:MAG: lipoprotein NlpI [bacterium ADurb.Bin363]HPZ07586.1 tetratricopeptide repeat protein [Candidatus Eremiobacteraeota bacterium]
MKKIIILTCLLSIIILITFSNSLNNGFTNWDDEDYILSNKLIRELSWENLITMFTTVYVGHYHPITLLTYSLEYYSGKLDPFIYHLTSLIIHMFNSLLVFWLIFMFTNNLYSSFTGAILFGIHPLRVEAVAWVSGTKELLCTFFYTGTIIFYLHYLKKKNLKYYFLSLLLFILSILSKSMAITLPVVLIGLNYFFYRNSIRNMIIDKIPFFAIAFIIQSITLSGGLVIDTFSFTFLERMLIASHRVIFYLYKTLLPISLSCRYPYPEESGKVMGETVFLISLLTLVLLTTLVIYTGKYTKKIISGSLFFLVTLLPVIQLIPAAQPIADRYTYIPSIGLSYIAGEGFLWLYSREFKDSKIIKSLLITILIIIIISLSVLTWNRCTVWKDGLTLWSDVIKNYPHSAIAYNYRGLIYHNMGEYDYAIRDYTKALMLIPYDTKILNNRGIAYYSKGDCDSAIVDFTQALKFKSDYSEALYNRGLVYEHRGEYNTALSDFTLALKFNPNYYEVYNSRGIIYGTKGEYKLAVADFTHALKINPAYPDAYYNRAFTYFTIKEYDRAWEDIQKMKDAGYTIPSQFIDDLIRASRREK